MNVGLTLKELAERVGGEVHGDDSCVIRDVAPLQNAAPGAISFLANSRYRKYLAATKASAVILTRDDLADCPVSALVSDKPHLVYARVAALLYPVPTGRRGIHPTAWVDESCSIHDTAWVGPHSVIEAGVVLGPGVQVGPGCVIGEGVTIGEGSRLVANVTICSGTCIGMRALIHPGAVIGGDGFGLANDGGVWVKVPQLGRVRIGDDVEIGANTTIDRGALEDTVLEDGVKLDNQIQIGHNVKIGAHTAIAACTGISGSTKIGKHCTIAGGVGIAGHIEIADNVRITGMSMVTKSVPEPGAYSSGIPLQPNHLWHRSVVRFKQLDDLARRVKTLEDALDALRGLKDKKD